LPNDLQPMTGATPLSAHLGGNHAGTSHDAQPARGVPMRPFSVSVFTSKSPLGKEFSLDGGHLAKRSRGELWDGTVDTHELRSLREFVQLRASLTSQQALGYGTCGHAKAQVTVSRKIAEASSSRGGGALPLVARDAKHFSFKDGPGILFIDYDPPKGKPAICAEDLHRVLVQSMPALQGVTMWWAPSAGSCIYHDIEQLVGIRGCRFYLVISDARSAKLVGDALFGRLVQAGHGHVHITGAGSQLLRSPVDASVWQAERLDYVRATCLGELNQDLDDPRVFGTAPGAPEVMLDVAQVPELGADEINEVERIKAALFKDSEPAAERQRTQWSKERGHEQAKREDKADDPEYVAALQQRYREAVRGLTLPLGHVVKLRDGTKVTVRDLQRGDHEGARMYDPVEPEYSGGDPRIAMLICRMGRYSIRSHAHGGVEYQLESAESPEQDFPDDPPSSPERVFRDTDYVGLANALLADEWGGAAAPKLRRWGGTWYEWTGTHYKELDMESVDVRVRRWLATVTCPDSKGNRVPFPISVRKVLEVIHALRACVQLEADTLPSWAEAPKPGSSHHGVAARDLIAMTNGLYDLRSGRLLPHTPSLFSLQSLPFAFDPRATCPNWRQFLDSVWGDSPDSIAALQYWTGYVLSGDTSQQKIALIVGAKRSGKGTIGQVIEGLVGRENVASPSLADLSSSFGRAPMIGKSLAIVADARSVRDSQKAVEPLLRISGEDSVQIDRKNRDAWMGRLGVRLMFMSNELPMLADNSGALASRFLVWYMPKSFYGKEDPTLAKRLLAELPGIFNWAIEGWQELEVFGKLFQPSSGKEYADELLQLNSPVARFVQDRCELGEQYSVDKAELYRHYRQYQLETGARVDPEVTFHKSLRAYVPGLQDHRPRNSEDGSRQRHLVGLRLRPYEISAEMRAFWDEGTADANLNEELEDWLM